MSFHFSVADLINIIIITIGIGICGMVFLHITTSEDLKRQKAFRRYFQFFFVCLFLCITSHLIRIILEGLPGEGIHNTLNVLPLIEAIFVSALAYMMSMLLLSISRMRYRKQFGIVLHVLLGLQIVFLIISSINGLSYYFDNNNIYHRGSLYITANIIPAIILVICMVTLLFFGKGVNRLVKIAFWVFIATPLIAILIQAWSYGVQYIILALIASSLFMYFAILKVQSEEYKRQNEAISKLQNGLILVLADLVESRDQCTGDHIKKTAEYVNIIMEQLSQDGIYSEQLTDTFIKDVVRSAPLHDIGKMIINLKNKFFFAVHRILDLVPRD